MTASYVYESMRPYQRTGAHFMRRVHNALLTDQPGLGKTIQSLGTIIAKQAQEDAKMYPAGPVPKGANSGKLARWHFVVTPKVAVRNVWEPEIARWLRDKHMEVLTLTGTLAERQASIVGFQPASETEHVFVIGNIEAVRIKPVDDEGQFPRTLRKGEIIRYKGGKPKHPMAYHPSNALLPALFERTWDTVIVDESHRALIRTSGVPSQTRAGFVLLKSRRRIALSGTPMRGKPEQLWGTLNWLEPTVYTSYWKWVQEFFEVTADRYSQYNVGGLTPSGRARLAESLQGIMLRRTKAEVAPELPPKTYAGAHIIEGDDSSPLGVWLEMEPNQSKQYDRLITEGLIGNSEVNGTLAEYTRQRQIAGAYHEVYEDGENVRLVPVVEGSPKFEWLTEWLDQNDGEKVVVVSQFTSLLKAYEKALTEPPKSRGKYVREPVKVAAITGEVSEKRRTAAIEGFQHGDVQVMLLNTKAGGVALTLDAADYLVFLDETKIPDDQEQAEDRIHRVSRMHNVTIYYLRILNSIEEEVAYVAAARQDVQRYLMDGHRGVEYAKQIYLQSKADAAKPSNSKAR